MEWCAEQLEAEYAGDIGPAMAKAANAKRLALIIRPLH
jgi:hypothetical protein